MCARARACDGTRRVVRGLLYVRKKRKSQIVPILWRLNALEKYSCSGTAHVADVMIELRLKCGGVGDVGG